MVHAASGEGSGVCVRAFCVVGAEAGPVVPLTNGFSMAAATERILVHNGKLMDNCNTTPKQLIEDCPGGVYTTARTIHRAFIVDFAVHEQRICALTKQGAQEDQLKAVLRASLVIGLTTFYQYHTEEEIEARITVVAVSNTSNQSGFDVYVLCERLAALPIPPVTVDVVHAERSNPSIKHTQWVTDRKPLENSMTPGANEVLMVNHEEQFTEGLSSNFFVVKEGQLYTAPDGMVLLGTIRALVIKAAHNLNIVINFQAPLFSEMTLWEGAFICSTSRLVLAIKTTRIKEKDGSTREYEVPQSDVAEQVSKEVVRIMRSEATQIIVQ